MTRIPVVLCVVLLTSCWSAPAPSSLPAGVPPRPEPRTGAGSRFSLLFSFDGSDGKEPDASLIAVGGSLYGTTYGGGEHESGTAFEIATSGAQTVLHGFKGGTDGALPEASLLDVSGTLYGTTVNGGGSGDEGTVFKISPSRVESVIYRFKAGRDGANPYAGLVDVGGKLYGTTAGGGRHSQGTAYAVSSAGIETVLHSFGARLGDGTNPRASLTNVGGTLYGTTAFGGAYCGSLGCGTVFKIATSGAEKPVYSFGGGKDGTMPASALVRVSGALYGTTATGGRYNRGTVFRITTSGSETVLHSFKGGHDGALPGGLTAANGILYGVTTEGGSGGAGTVFKVTTTGQETVLHAFGVTEGARPEGGLRNVGGTLYGTTAAGGAGGFGTVFSITP